MTSVPLRDALDDKVNRTFAGKVVRKDLVRRFKVGANVVHKAATRVASHTVGKPVHPQSPIVTQVQDIGTEQQRGGVRDEAPVAAPPE